MRLNVFLGLPGTHSILSTHLNGEYSIPKVPRAQDGLKSKVIAGYPEKMYFLLGPRDRDNLSKKINFDEVLRRYFEDIEYSETIIGANITAHQLVRILWKRSPAGTRFFFFKGAESQATKIKEFSELLSEKPERLQWSMDATASLTNEEATNYETNNASEFESTNFVDLGLNLNTIGWTPFNSTVFRGGAAPTSSDVLVKLVVKP